MRVLQEWMGHRDLSATQRYADYAPNPQELSMAEAAFRTGSRSRDAALPVE
jgi:site-specific recombinase XerD